MPKNKSKKNAKRDRNGTLGDLLKVDSAPPSQDEDTISEGSSIFSNCVDLSAEETGNDGPADVTPMELIEDKLKEAIEGLTEKNTGYRYDCLKQIRKFLLSYWLNDFLENYKETVMDGLDKCLRKGKGEEQALAAEVLAILTIQIGGTGEEESIYAKLKPYMITVIADPSSSVIARAKFAQVLGFLAFVGVDDIDEILSCMTAFDSLFGGSFLKGDKSVPVVKPAVSELHLRALSSWCLLLSVTPWSKVKDFAESRLPRLPELLTSSNVDLRITAGETIALFYEILQSEDATFMMRRLLNEKELVNDLKELATDSSKYRAKKDRKVQRSSFRDILRTVEVGEAPEQQLKFGSESIFIDSWTTMRQYTAIKELLGQGLNLHLKENSFVRNIFDLGPPSLSRDESSKSSRLERHLFNQAVFKARSQARGKLRDKRTAFRT